MFIKFLFIFVLGIVGGLIISAYLPARVQYKGKIKQRGQNNTIQIKKSDQRKTKREEKKENRRGLLRRNRNKK
jgi:Rieske Fe-S protein